MKERLTTENPETNIEMMLNHIFVKDGKAFYRDHDREIDLLDLMREMCSKHACPADADELDDETLGETLYDNLYYGIDTTEGITALYYFTAVGYAELREKLKKYEDAEEKETQTREAIINEIARKNFEERGMSEEMREFLLLVLENPGLPIVPMVSFECVGGDDYTYWLSKISSSEIREYAIDEWYGDGVVRFKDDGTAEADLIEAIAETKYDGTDEDYEKAKQEAAGLWVKAIVVYINPAEVI